MTGVGLFGPIRRVADVAAYLDANHYLGRAKRGFAWEDEYGVLVLANPSSRHLPQRTWLELIRWCREMPHVTTVVSYSDPSAGHTGALYRACNWTWAPTWQRLYPPPSGNGSWDGGVTMQATKDRWIYSTRRDDARAEILRVKDGRFRPEHLERAA